MNKTCSIAGLLLSIVLFSSVIKAEPVNNEKSHVGVVILVSGDVTAIGENDKTRFLKRRSKFYVGDIVQVSVLGRAQLRFLDGTLVSLDENTQVKIDEFLFSNENNADNKNFFTLIKGGLRTITGAIGKTNPNAHAVNTPVATIGVRGTQYSAHFDERLSVGVYKGDVRISNEMGSLDIGAHGKFDYALVYDRSSAPIGSLIQPKILVPLSADHRSRFDVSSNSGNKKLLEKRSLGNTPQSWLDQSNKDALIVSSIDGVSTKIDDTLTADNNEYALLTGDPLYNSTTDFRLTDKERGALHRFALAVTGGPDRVSLLKDRMLRMKSTDVADAAVGHVMVDAVGDKNTGFPRYVLRKSTSTINGTISSLTSYDRTGGANFIPVDIDWGKWDTQFVNQYDSMDPASFEKINNTLHWITATPTDPLSVGSLSGSTNYTDVQTIQGMTHNGLIDTVTGQSASINVDFSTSSFNGSIGFMDAAAETWSINMAGPINGSKLDFTTVSATYIGGSMTDGVAQGVFVGPAAELIGGAFNVQSTNGSGDYAEGIFSIGCAPGCL